MSSIRKHPKSPYWIACFTLPNGCRTTRTTRLPISADTREKAHEHREKAKEFAAKLELASRKASHNEMTTDQARALVNSLRDLAGLESVDNTSAQDFLRQWAAGRTNAGTRTRYQGVVESLLNQIGQAATANIANVGYQTVLGYLDKRRASGAAPKTLLVEAKILATGFNLALRLGKIQSNPVTQALAMKPISIESSTKGTFTLAQLHALFEAARGDWLTALLLGYYTAARLRDCCNLRKEMIDLERGALVLKQIKTDRTICLPIHPVLKAHLQSIITATGPTGFLCPDLANRKTGGKTGLSSEFNALMRLAAVDAGVIQGKGKRRFSTLSFHSLRHSSNSHLANCGVRQEIRMQLTDHQSAEMNDLYTQLDQSQLREAIDKLPDVRVAPVVPA